MTEHPRTRYTPEQRTYLGKLHAVLGRTYDPQKCALSRGEFERVRNSLVFHAYADCINAGIEPAASRLMDAYLPQWRRHDSQQPVLLRSLDALVERTTPEAIEAERKKHETLDNRRRQKYTLEDADRLLAELARDPLLRHTEETQARAWRKVPDAEIDKNPDYHVINFGGRWYTREGAGIYCGPDEKRYKLVALEHDGKIVKTEMTPLPETAPVTDAP
ncbi:MAG: hypothetical protein HYY37_05945 [Candidatus Aenigmarchaeota archaeon]|nr:hypothetical protein [Candidatus Aenigmarchaeota archaeon]